MASDVYKKKVKEIVNKAKDKGLIKTYSEICKTEDLSILSVAEEETVYYTSLFLLLYKSNYMYNQPLNKDELNKLHKDSVVKCDDLISISENDILFKIGEVRETDLERFVDTYQQYLNEN